MAPVAFRDFAEFEQKTIRATHTHHDLSDELLARVRAQFERHMTPAGAKFIRPMSAQFERHMTPAGAKFIRPMRVNLLRRV